MANETSVETGEPKADKKKREIKPILISNFPYFLFASIFLIMILVLLPEGAKKYGLIFIPMPFIFLAILISAVIAFSYGMKYAFKFEYDFSDAPILMKNWKRYYPNNWEAIKSNSLIVMFVFFACMMLAGALMEHKSTFILVMLGGFLAFVIPPATIYLLLKWKKMKYLAIGKLKLETNTFAFSWAIFLIIFLKLLQLLKQQKIMEDPHRMTVGAAVVVIAYIALIVLTLLQKNDP